MRMQLQEGFDPMVIAMHVFLLFFLFFIVLCKVSSTINNASILIVMTKDMSLFIMQIMDNKSIVYVFWGVVFILLLNITTNFEIKCQVFNNAFLSKGVGVGIFF